MVKFRTIACLALPLVAACVLSGPAAARPVRDTRTISAVTTLEAQVLTKVNTLRRGHGLAALHFSRNLSEAAQTQAQKMGQLGFFSHESADGSPFWKRVQHYYAASGYGYWSVGENLLWSSPDVDAGSALDIWMKSPQHRANLLMPRWREIGIAAVHVDAAPGVFGGQPVTIVDADFGVRK